MQSKTPLLMVTALVCGLGAAFGTWKLVSSASTAPADEVQVKVLVPVIDLAPYYLFQDAQRFTEMPWPKNKLREDIAETITSFDQIKNKTTRHYRLKPNEPIYKSDICDTRDDDINERLKNGEVAHAVQVTPDHAGGGFIQVGSRVDISATIQPSNGETAIKTQYVLEDIEVLAVDNQSKKETTQMAQPPSRFLLRLTKQQALVLKNYQDSTRIDIDLRRIGDPSRLGDSFYYMTGKKTSAVPGYQDDQPEATVAVNLEERKLPDPTDDTPRVKQEVKAEPIKPGDLTEEQRRLLPHEAIINDNGQPRKQSTNVKYEVTEIKKKDTSKKDEVKKDGSKDDGKTPGQ